MATSGQRLGERLQAAGLITPAQLEEALTRQLRTGEILGHALVALGHIAEDDLIRELCSDSGIPYLSAAELTVDPAMVAVVPESIARMNAGLALRLEGGRLVVALANPFDISAVTALERAAGRPVKVVAAPREAVLLRLDEAYGGRAAAGEETEATTAPSPAGLQGGTVAAHGEVGVARGGTRVELDDSATAAQMCEEIIRRGIALGATDIHVEPHPEATHIRFRLDGLLQDGGTYRSSSHAALISRFKIIGELNIAETRLPQDGRFRFRMAGREVDLRISTFPTMHGEDIVLRILDRSRVALDLDHLGISGNDLAAIRGALAQPHGLILVTGPTGSGKTTTLYSGLAELNSGDRCVMTLEDPIEYELTGIRQSQINVKAGLTFSSGLRSILRHDPDVILVGEMRDAETVQIALSAALTGHLVLSTLHTNTAAGAIPRLLDMGAEPFLLGPALQLVASQRLVRKLCPACRVEAQLPEPVRLRFGLMNARVYEARGCAACRQTGFSGRIGIFEVMPVTEELAARMLEGISAEAVRGLVRRSTMLDDGLQKVRAGLTSLNELLRVVVV